MSRKKSPPAALLPAALVVGHPGYLHGLHGHVPAGGVWLHIAAFDLARGPDGGWVVVGQRTQSPSGLGYVLENRLGVSRQFPQAFRQLNIQHLASGYRLLLQTLQTLAASASGGQPPRLALLTPGPYNETYFEHAYLARYLGLPLVEGSDLTVRGGAVYMKTVHGLEPVHGLLRRLDDDFCDPLELRPDSTLGVPGLLEAVREGRVVMANALGAGFLESPAIHGFLPGLCQRWLGEPLALPSLPTWWCGEAAAWQAVQGTADGLPGKAVHPTYPPTLGTGLRRGLQSATLPAPGPAHDAWLARIARDPGDLGPLGTRLDATVADVIFEGERLVYEVTLPAVVTVLEGVLGEDRPGQARVGMRREDVQEGLLPTPGQIGGGPGLRLVRVEPVDAARECWQALPCNTLVCVKAGAVSMTPFEVGLRQAA